MAERGLLTNHARVLACIALDPGVRHRDIASTVNITERSVFSIVDDLISGGYVAEVREGRRIRYNIHVNAPPLGEAFDRQQTLGELLKFLAGSKSARKHYSKRI